MVKASDKPTRVKGGPHLTVSWKAPQSKTWHHYEESVARALLAAAASGQATVTFTLPAVETLRRSPRLSALQPRRRGQKKSRPSAKEKTPRMVIFDSMRDKPLTSNAFRTIRWGFTSTCTFDQLPTSAPALAAMIAESEVEKKRQVLSGLLDFLKSNDRIRSFLSDKLDELAVSWPQYTFKRLERAKTNKCAHHGGALYARFLDSMLKHVAELGGALQTFMGSANQSIDPFAFVFHGTPSKNLPSILKKGMLPGKRRNGGDYFATSPMTSSGHCRTMTWPSG